MPLNFYDRAGTPIAYTDDGEHIFTISGHPVAYLTTVPSIPTRDDT